MNVRHIEIYSLQSHFLSVISWDSSDGIVFKPAILFQTESGSLLQLVAYIWLFW